MCSSCNSRQEYSTRKRSLSVLDLMLDEYYAERGWDKNGIPTKEKLAELGLEDVIKDLERQGAYK